MIYLSSARANVSLADDHACRIVLLVFTQLRVRSTCCTVVDCSSLRPGSAALLPLPTAALGSLLPMMRVVMMALSVSKISPEVDGRQR